MCLLTNAIRGSTKSSTVIIYLLHQILLLITSSNLQETHEMGNFPSLSSLLQRQIKSPLPNPYVEGCSPNDCHCSKAAVRRSCQDINERLNLFLLKRPLPHYMFLGLRLMAINNIIMVELRQGWLLMEACLTILCRVPVPLLLLNINLSL